MTILDNLNVPLGMGCWPIGGAMFDADGNTLGYANADDNESIRTIHAALDCGITVFDTAAAYGAGHAEKLLGQAIKAKPEAIVITKIGMSIDEESKRITGEENLPESVLPAIERCLKRLDRDQIDILLLHLNALPAEQAIPLFDEMEKAVAAGKIRAYGWSTDFTDNASAMIARPNFVAIEHAMNVLSDAPAMQTLIESNQCSALLRSPLAMGLLSGKYHQGQNMPANDIRSTTLQWMQYYRDAQPNPEYLSRFNKIRELLQSNGRMPVQGALAWIWAKSKRNIPIPGARTVEQIEGLAGAVDLGPLDDDVIDEIESLVERDKDWTEDMER